MMAAPAPSGKGHLQGRARPSERKERKGLPTARDDPRTLQCEIAIRSPDLTDARGSEEDEARRIDVGELVAPQALELPEDGGVMLDCERKELEPRQFSESEVERSRRLLTEPMEEPTVRLGHHGERGRPASGRIGEQAQGRCVVLVGSVEKAMKTPLSRKTGPAVTAAASRIHHRVHALAGLGVA